MGSALTFINSVHRISLVPETLITVFAVCNCTLRIVTGILTDRFAQHVSRQLFYTCSVAAMGVSMAMFAVAVGNDDLMIIVAACIGMSEGMLFATWPVLVREDFGMQSFGRNFSLLNCAIGVGSLLCNLLATSVTKGWTPGVSPAPAYAANAVFCFVGTGLAAVSVLARQRRQLQVDDCQLQFHASPAHNNPGILINP